MQKEFYQIASKMERKADTFRIVNTFVVLFVLAMGLVLAGCGTGRALVMEPVKTRMSVGYAEVIRGESTVDVPTEVEETFHKKLEHLLYEKGGSKKGPELRITYRFLMYDRGNQFTRWFWGSLGNAGEGSMYVEAIYSDSTGSSIAKIQSEGRIDSGLSVITFAKKPDTT